MHVYRSIYNGNVKEAPLISDIHTKQAYVRHCSPLGTDASSYGANRTCCIYSSLSKSSAIASSSSLVVRATESKAR